MELNRKFLFLSVPVIVALAVTLSAALSVPKPIGSDFYWHLNLSSMIAGGNVDGAVNYLLSPAGNNFPYGFFVSVFHLGFVPLVWSGFPLFWAQVLQVLFLPTTLALTVWLVYKFASVKAAFFSGLILLGSWAFVDGALQVRPESLDLLLYPLMVASVLAVQKYRFVGLAVFTVYNHGVAALSNVYGLAASKLKDKTWRVSLAVGVAAILPVLAVSLWYLSGAFVKWGGAGATENPQEVLFWTDPTFIPYYMGATILGVPFLLKKAKTPLEVLVTWGFVGNLVMLPLWADRWLHYASLPLAIVGGIGIAGLKGKWKLIALFILLDIVIVYAASYFTFSFHIGGSRWWQPGD